MLKGKDNREYSNLKQLLRDLLLENNFDHQALYPLYDEFIAAKYITMSYESYTRYVRKASHKFKEKLSEYDSKIDLFKEVNKDSKILNDQVKEALPQKLECIQNILTKVSIEQLEKVLEIVQNEDVNFDTFVKMKGKNAHLENVIKDMKRELNHLNLKTHAENGILEELHESIARFTPDKISMDVTVREVRNTGIYKNVLLLSDIHFGETVNPIEINGINEYNREIAKSRLIDLFHKNLEFAKFNECNECHMMFMGDFFSGIIHEEIVETNDGVMTQLIVELYGFLAGLVEEYSKYFNRIIINCVVGNHGRLGEKVKFKRKAQTNFEYLLYKFIETYFQNHEKIEVNVSESPFMICNVGNIKWKISHGDEFKGSSNFLNLPAMTISRDTIKEKSMLRDIGKDFNVMSMGHFHVPAIFHSIMNRPIILNSSVVGGNEYSVHRLHTAFPPSQYAFICNDNKIICDRLIYL